MSPIIINAIKLATLLQITPCSIITPISAILLVYIGLASSESLSVTFETSSRQIIVSVEPELLGMKTPYHCGLGSIPLQVLSVFFFMSAFYYIIKDSGAICKFQPFKDASGEGNQDIVHTVQVACSSKSHYVSLKANASTMMDKKYEISGRYNYTVLWVFVFLGFLNITFIKFWIPHGVDEDHNATKYSDALYYRALKSYSKKYSFSSAVTLAVFATQLMGFYILLDVGNQGWPKIEWMNTEFENRSDPWTKFFPREVWCDVSSKYYQCLLSANSSIEEIHFFALWLLLALFVVTLADFAGICYFTYALRSLPESKKSPIV